MNNSLNAALPCCKNSKCFAYWDGKCSALTNTSFRGKCPFFKDKEEKALEDIRCKARVGSLTHSMLPTIPTAAQDSSPKLR